MSSPGKKPNFQFEPIRDWLRSFKIKLGFDGVPPGKTEYPVGTVSRLDSPARSFEIEIRINRIRNRWSSGVLPGKPKFSVGTDLRLDSLARSFVIEFGIV